MLDSQPVKCSRAAPAGMLIQHAGVPVPRRPKDDAAWAAPFAVTVRELRDLLIVLAPLAIVSWAIVIACVRRCIVGEYDLTARWLVVLAILTLVPLGFSTYGFFRTLVAYVSIAQPGYELAVAPVAALAKTKEGAAAAPKVDAKARDAVAALDAEIGTVLAYASRMPHAPTVTLVRARFAERLGNNVFQYVVARLRSMYLGVDLFQSPKLYGPFKHVDDCAAHAGNGVALAHPYSPMRAAACLVSAFGAAVKRQGARSAADLQRAASGADVALDPAVAAALSAPFMRHWRAWLAHPASGYVMNARLFLGHHALIRQWLQPSVDAALATVRAEATAAAAPVPSIVSDAAAAAKAAAAASRSRVHVDWSSHDMADGVAVHVRLGDILYGHHAAYRPLPLTFYKQALRVVAWRIKCKREALAAGAWEAASPVDRAALMCPAHRAGALADHDDASRTGSTQGTRRRRTPAAQVVSSTVADGASAGPAACTCHSTPGSGAAAAALPPTAAAAIPLTDAEASALVQRVVLVTEDRTHEIIARLREALEADGYAVSTQSASLAADFLALYTAPNLILSLSSFAWWAAFLGRADTVVVPEFGILKQHAWQPRAGVHAQHDLSLYDELPVLAGGSSKAAAAASPSVVVSAGGVLAVRGILTPADVVESGVVPVISSAASTAASPSQVTVAVDVLEWRRRFLQHFLAQSGYAVCGAPGEVDTSGVVDALCEQVDRAAASAGIRDDAGAVAGAGGAAGGLVPSWRVATMRMSDLPRWDGDFRHTMDALFAC